MNEATLGELFAAEVRARGSDASVRIEGVLEQRALVTTADGLLSTAPPVLVPAAPRVYLGDLFPRVPLEQGVAQYVREVSPADTDLGASAVPEGDTKPDQPLQFEGGQMLPGKFAAFVGATNEIADDAPGFQALIDGLLMHRLLRREEVEILDGDGTGENLAGIRGVAGVQSQTYDTSAAKTLALAVAKAENANGGGQVDGIGIEAEAYELAVATAPSYWAELRARGIRVVPLPARVIGASKAIVGCFGLGGVLRERDTTVRYSDSYDDWFTEGKLAIVAERREALIVNVPSWFVDVALA